MKPIVFLFINKTNADREEYVHSNIESVKVTTEDVPNSTYSQEMEKSRLYEKDNRVFSEKTSLTSL